MKILIAGVELYHTGRFHEVLAVFETVSIQINPELVCP